jgi:hypothetical protein
MKENEIGFKGSEGCASKGEDEDGLSINKQRVFQK